MDTIKESERRAEEMRAENEALDEELSRAEKKKAIREAKEFYGNDLKKMVKGAVGGISKLRVKAETMQNLHSLGFGTGAELRNLNNPTTWKKR